MASKASTTKEKKVTIDKLEEVKKTLNEKQKRFVHLYIGAEDGRSFGNATDAYLRAYYGDGTPKRNPDGSYSKAYETARTNGSALLANTRIQEYKSHLELEVGFKPEEIKKRFSQLANQNKNLPVALSANEKRAKIAGVIKDEAKVDIPQLEAIGQTLKTLLTPKK